jgi:exonuclease VII small subunit
VRAADDLHVMYEEGRAAYHAGQLELAREKLSYVLSKAPNHLPTKAMMVQIERQIGADNASLRKSYEKIIIERIEFNEVPLEEALQVVRAFSLKATGGKVAPNVIIKNPELGKRTVSLNLAQVPLSEVLNYLAQLTSSRLHYDKSAVMITTLADVRPVPAPPSTPTVPATPTQPTTTRQALDRNSLPFYLPEHATRRS